jgi:histidine triad (HIT) family protein
MGEESEEPQEEASPQDTQNMSPEEIARLQKQNCIFCKIVSKEIPAKILHEDDDVICILDINPASEGHILVMPKKHYMILPHIPEPLQEKLFITVRLMSNTLLKAMQCKGTSIFIANGSAAGQKAPHVLIHVFPRTENDGLLTLPVHSVTDEENAKTKSLSQYFYKIFGGKPNEKIAEFKETKKEPEKTDPKHKIETESVQENNPKDKNTDLTKHSPKQRLSVDDAKEKTKKTARKEKAQSEHQKPENAKQGVNLDDITRLFG